MDDPRSSKRGTGSLKSLECGRAGQGCSEAPVLWVTHFAAAHVLKCPNRDKDGVGLFPGDTSVLIQRPCLKWGLEGSLGHEQVWYLGVARAGRIVPAVDRSDPCSLPDSEERASTTGPSQL